MILTGHYWDQQLFRYAILNFLDALTNERKPLIGEYQKNSASDLVLHNKNQSDLRRGPSK